MHKIKEMLKKMCFKIVADEMKTTEWTENGGFFITMKDNIYHRIDCTVDSYGNELSNIYVKEVTPKEVTKVEYI